MSKRRRKRLNRNKRTRSRRNFIRNGIEQLENRVLPGGFLDLLAGAAIAAAFDLLPDEHLVPEEIESESDLFTLRDRSANTLLRNGLSLPDVDLQSREVSVELTPAGEDVDIASASHVTTGKQLAASFVDSFFTGNQFVDASPSRPVAESSPPATPNSSFNSPISQLGAGVGAGSGQGYNVTGAELPQMAVSTTPTSTSPTPAWMIGEGEGGASATGSASASGSGSGGTTATSTSCSAGGYVDFSSADAAAAAAAAAAPAVVKVVDEGESFELGLEKHGVGEVDHFTVDWGDGSGATGPYYDVSSVSYSYYDDDLTDAPSDDYTVTVTSHDACGNVTSASAIITVNNVAPTAEPDAEDADEEYGVSIDVLSNDFDIGADELSVVSVDASGAQGKVTLEADGTISYDPDGKFNHLLNGETATDTFTYVVRDDDSGESTGTVTVTVHGVTHVPVVVSGSEIEHTASGSVDYLVWWDSWTGDYFAKGVATDQVNPDERSDRISIGASSIGTWFRPPFFFSARSAEVTYSVPMTCDGNKITADTNAPMKSETNVYVQAVAESTAVYNSDHTQVTVVVALGVAYGGAPDITVSFGSEDGGDSIGASISISGADFQAKTDGTFVYECRRWP